MKNKSKLNFVSFISISAFNSILDIFNSTFLVAYLFQTTAKPVYSVGMYFLFYYLITVLVYFLCGYFLEKTNRVWTFRIGTVLRCVFILLVFLLKAKAGQFVLLLGAVHGVASGLYYAPYNLMKNELIEDDKIRSLNSYSTIINKILAVLVPVIFGSIIEYSSFIKIAIYVLFIGIIQVVFSFMLSAKDSVKGEYTPFKFWAIVYRGKNEFKPIIYTWWTSFCEGILTATPILITLMIMLSWGSNLSLGVITSIIGGVAVLVVALYSIIKHRKWNIITLVVCVILPIFSGIALVVSFCKTTLIIYNLLSTISLSVLSFQYNYYRNKIIKEFETPSNICEYQAISEAYLNFGRIVSFALMILLGLLNSMVAYDILLIVYLLVTPLYAILLIKTHSHRHNNKIETDNQV